MKFNFKIQQYQTDAVDAVVKVFNGQGFHDKINYIRDLGNTEQNLSSQVSFDENEIMDDTGYKNELVELSDEQLLQNIQNLQSQNNIKLSPSLVKDLGRCSLDIEMETGTGKTYVYIKTMFELNKKYGWSKFIVVVPSIAIREGVKKSFEITADHFMEHYGKKARFFIYNSSNLNQLDNFSSSSGINVMIINTQAFAASLKEGGRSKESRIIYSKRDEFGSRRPIDVIKANRPIIILDEPQKMGGAVTQKALKNFNPLFTLNYSATHAKQHNLVYVLDALDAFNKKLVKKIEVKGFEVKISEVRTVICTLNRLCCRQRNHLWQKSSLKSDIKNPLTVNPVFSVWEMICTMFLRKWSSTRDIQFQKLTHFVEQLHLQMVRLSKPAMLSVMCPKKICAVFRLERLFFLILKKKKSSLIWVLNVFLCSLLMKLQSIVNMMRTAMKCLASTVLCLRKSI